MIGCGESYRGRADWTTGDQCGPADPVDLLVPRTTSTSNFDAPEVARDGDALLSAGLAEILGWTPHVHEQEVPLRCG